MAEKKEVKKAKKPEKSEKIDSTVGEGLSTAGFIVAVASLLVNIFTFGIVAVVGLVLSIIGRVQTSKAGHPSGLALAGIIISGISMLLTFLLFIFFVLLVVVSASYEDTNDPCYGLDQNAPHCIDDRRDMFQDMHREGL